MRNDRGARTREALLESAARAFAESHYEAVSVTRITTDAGAAAGAVNYHFGSKRGLYMAVLEADFRALWARVIQLRGAMGHRLGQGIDILLDHAEAHPQSFLALTTSVADPEVRAVRDAVRSEMFDAFLLELTGGVRSPQIEAAVAAAVSGAETIVAQWITTRSFERREARTLILAGVRSYLVTAIELEPRAVLSPRAVEQLLGAIGDLGHDSTTPPTATPANPLPTEHGVTS